LPLGGKSLVCIQFRQPVEGSPIHHRQRSGISNYCYTVAISHIHHQSLHPFGCAFNFTYPLIAVVIKEATINAGCSKNSPRSLTEFGNHFSDSLTFNIPSAKLRITSFLVINSHRFVIIKSVGNILKPIRAALLSLTT
jgi:hypothetical protein